MAIDALLLLLTFALGLALARVSLCAVGALQQLIHARQYDGLLRLLLATSGAGVTLLLLAGLAPGQVLLPADVATHAGAITGGVLLGLGALINGGCYLGSVLYLGSGNLNFLLTLVGIAGGEFLSTLASGMALPAAANLRMSMGPAWIAGAAGFILIILVVLFRARSRGRWLALGAGLLAGLVYARHPGWSYGTVLDSIARGNFVRMTWIMNLAALLLFAGAVSGALLAGRFHLQWPTAARSLRCLAGGAIMGVGAARVPGGNDLLLLWAIPGLTIYGALAYASMLLLIAAGLLLGKRWRPGLAGTPG
jgi:uncharacterized membrane protein YedE/YeeE